MARSLLLVAAAAVAAARTGPAVPVGFVAKHNSNPNKKWTASEESAARFQGLTLAQVSKMMGSRPSTPASRALHNSEWDLEVSTSLPASFDVRTAFPWANNVTSVVRDQSACGSCWAFGSTEAFNDRMAILKNYTHLLSAADTAWCCTGMSNGCDGGFTDEAWSYFTSKGIVTGAGFDSIGSGSSCLPYPFEICSHHEPNPAHPNCPTNEFSTKACPKGCSEKTYPVAWGKDTHLASTSFRLNSVAAAMTDLVARGTVTASFDVQSDFLTYKSGVYSCSGGTSLGGHAVSIIGYGTDASGTDYWIVRNSWNPTWGNGGTFMIERGTNTCGFESDLVAGTV